MYSRIFSCLSVAVIIFSLISVSTANLQRRQRRSCLPAKVEFSRTISMLRLVGILRRRNYKLLEIRTSRDAIEDDMQELFLHTYSAVSNCSQHSESNFDNQQNIPDLSALVGTADDFVLKGMEMLHAEFDTYTSRPRTRLSTLGDMLYGGMQRRMFDVIEVYINYVIYRLLPEGEIEKFLGGLRPYTRIRLSRAADRIYMHNVLENNPPGNFWELGRD